MSKKLRLQELKDRIAEGEHVQIVDVRSVSEYASGHIPGAINLPMDQIESRLGDLDAQRPVVLVCQRGRRADITQSLLNGHLDTLVLEGGTNSWANSGCELVTSTTSRWSLERQVRLMAGLLGLLGITLSLTVHPVWLALSAFVSLGLTFAGLTDLCLMASLFSLMPWNRACAVKLQRRAQ